MPVFFSSPNQENSQNHRSVVKGIPSLCSPGRGLSCFRCCPPIRPAGYDHWDYQSSLKRLLRENRAAFLSGRLPQKPMLGFWCDGLGFLESGERRAGCLFHPARNQGRDLRDITGYGDKCRREWCLEARAFALLSLPDQDRLIDLCRGMDSFVYSSPDKNPLMNLLGLGPQVARAALARARDLREFTDWPWLKECEPAWGWLLGLIARQKGPGILGAPQLAGRLACATADIAGHLDCKEQTGPVKILAELCDLWEGRFWRCLTHRREAARGALEKWREKALEIISDF